MKQFLEIDIVEYNQFLESLLSVKIDLFKENLKEYLLKSNSFHQTENKNTNIFYNRLMYKLILNASETYNTKI